MSSPQYTEKQVKKPSFAEGNSRVSVLLYIQDMCVIILKVLHGEEDAECS